MPLMQTLLILAAFGLGTAYGENLCNDLTRDQVQAPLQVIAHNPNRFKTNLVFLKDQVGYAIKAVFKAIGATHVIPDAHPGSIYASPTAKIPGHEDESQDYRYAWPRDEAKTKSVLVRLYKKARAQGDLAFAKQLRGQIELTVEFRKLTQSQDNRSGKAYDRGLLEPKFLLSGKPFMEDWGRHQSDGPAFQAVVHMEYADILIADGEMDLVKTEYYNTTPGAHSVILDDLNAVAKYCMEKTFDYWEEREGYHFATSLAHKNAMRRGREFAVKMGDAEGAARFEAAEKKIDALLDRFYDPQAGYIRASILDWDHGLSLLDIEVPLGVNHSGPDLGPYSPLDDRVLQTNAKLVKTFREIYPINKNEKSSTGESLAEGMGRNREDAYDGYLNQPGKRWGNPWFISTLGMAENHHRFIKSLLIAKKVRVTQRSLENFELLGLKQKPKVGTVYQFGTPEFADLIEANLRRAEGFIARVKNHVGIDGEMSEQFNRENGMMQGVEHLTWNYAAVLSLVLLMEEEHAKLAGVELMAKQKRAAQMKASRHQSRLIQLRYRNTGRK